MWNSKQFDMFIEFASQMWHTYKRLSCSLRNLFGKWWMQGSAVNAKMKLFIHNFSLDINCLDVFYRCNIGFPKINIRFSILYRWVVVLKFNWQQKQTGLSKWKKLFTNWFSNFCAKRNDPENILLFKKISCKSLFKYKRKKPHQSFIYRMSYHICSLLLWVF